MLSCPLQIKEINTTCPQQFLPVPPLYKPIKHADNLAFGGIKGGGIAKIVFSISFQNRQTGAVIFLGEHCITRVAFNPYFARLKSKGCE